MTPKQIGAFAVGPLVAALLSLITLPVIAWFFSPEDVGRMAMLQVATSFSTLLFSLGLDQAYVREFHETEDKPALLKRSILPGLVLLVGTVAVILSFDNALSQLLFDVKQRHLSVLIAITFVAAFLTRFLSLILRMNERGLAYSMSQLLPKLILLVIICSYVISGASNSLTNLVIANTVATTFVCLTFGWNSRSEWLASIGRKIEVDRLGSMLRYGLPLILGGVAFWGLTAIDKVFLRTLAGFDELGIYSVAVSFAGGAVILQSVFSTVWAPMVYKWASSGTGFENIFRVQRYMLALVVLGFSLAGLLSWVVIFFLPSEYAAVQWVVVSCMGYPLLYTLSESTVVGIGISRRSEFAMLAAVVAFAISVAGNWLLIPAYGAAGAAASTCLSFWVFFLLRTEFSVRLWKPIPRRLMYGYSALMVFGACTFTLWGEYIGRLMIAFWAALLASVGFCFSREVREVYRFINARKIRPITSS